MVHKKVITTIKRSNVNGFVSSLSTEDVNGHNVWPHLEDSTNTADQSLLLKRMPCRNSTSPHLAICETYDCSKSQDSIRQNDFAISREQSIYMYSNFLVRSNYFQL